MTGTKLLQNSLVIFFSNLAYL